MSDQSQDDAIFLDKPFHGTQFDLCHQLYRACHPPFSVQSGRPTVFLKELPSCF
jgi:hypothetical protein